MSHAFYRKLSPDKPIDKRLSNLLSYRSLVRHLTPLSIFMQISKNSPAYPSITNVATPTRRGSVSFRSLLDSQNQDVFTSQEPSKNRPPFGEALNSVNAQPELPDSLGQPRKTPDWLASTQQFKSPAGFPITLYTLKNGHRLLVEQRPTDVVGIRTFVDVGSIVEDAVYKSPLYRNMGLPSGITHLDEHCHFLTTEHFPGKNEWAARVAQYGASANASTDNEVVQHELFCNKEDLNNILPLHIESILHPTYNAQDIPQEKAAVINEIALRNKVPAFKLEDRLDQLLFERPAWQTGGRNEDVATTTPEQLRLFYKMAYRPDKMTTIVSGNVSPDNILQMAGSGFSQNPNHMSLPVNSGLKVALRPNEVRTAVIHDPEWSNSRIAIGFPAPSITNAKDRMAMAFLTEYLDGDSMAPLSDKLVVGSRLALHESMDYEPLKQTGVAQIQLSCQPGMEKQALAKTMDILKQTANKPVDPATINTIRERLVARFLQAQGTVEASTAKIGSEASNHNLNYFLNYPAIAASITPEDLVRVTKDYLNPQRCAIVYGLPLPKNASKAEQVEGGAS